jgi:hypothetical protein
MTAAEPREASAGRMGVTAPTPEAVAAAFTRLSQAAAQACPALGITPDQILREDVVSCLEAAAGRRLAPAELAAATAAYALDTSATIGRPEFEASLAKWLSIVSSQATAASGALKQPVRSRARLLAARKKGLPLRAGVGSVEPLTSSQEIGWGADAAAAARVCGAPGERRRALRSTDVTAGGQGTSLATYYGAALGQAF